MINSKEFEKIRSLIEDTKVCMFVTQKEDKMKSRPFTTAKVDEAGNIWFFTSKETDAIREIRNNPQVNLAYSAPDEHDYLSIAGNAFINNDRTKIEELWNPIMKAWYPDGKDSANIILVKVEPISAAYWDASSNMLVELFKIGKAILTNSKYEGSEVEKVEL